MARVAIDEHAVAKHVQQRWPERAREVPQQVGALRQLTDGRAAEAIGLHGLQDRGGRPLGHEQQGAPVTETVRGHASEECVDPRPVELRVAGCAQQLEPPRVVAERAEAEEVLEKPGPVAAALRVVREASRQNDAEPAHGVSSQRPQRKPASSSSLASTVSALKYSSAIARAARWCRA
jgi:hypothetical protein